MVGPRQRTAPCVIAAGSVLELAKCVSGLGCVAGTCCEQVITVRNPAWSVSGPGSPKATGARDSESVQVRIVRHGARLSCIPCDADTLYCRAASHGRVWRVFAPWGVAGARRRYNPSLTAGGAEPVRLTAAPA